MRRGTLSHNGFLKIHNLLLNQFRSNFQAQQHRIQHKKSKVEEARLREELKKAQEALSFLSEWDEEKGELEAEVLQYHCYEEQGRFFRHDSIDSEQFICTGLKVLSFEPCARPCRVVPAISHEATSHCHVCVWPL